MRLMGDRALRHALAFRHALGKVNCVSKRAAEDRSPDADDAEVLGDEVDNGGAGRGILFERQAQVRIA